MNYLEETAQQTISGVAMSAGGGLLEERNYWSRALEGGVSRRTVLRGVGIAGAGLAGAALIGCGSKKETTAAKAAAAAAAANAQVTASDPFANIKRGGILKGDLTADPATIDPYGNASFTAKGIAAYTYSRLYKVAARGDKNPYAVGTEPDLAQSAESTDGQHWTVKLKRGVKFHNITPVNGREVTTEDVVASWKRLTDAKGPNKDAAKDIKLEAVDASTLKFTLPKPTATFLDFISDSNLLWIQPKEVGSGFDPKTQMIGSGPWVMSEYKPNVKFAFKRHTEYHDKPKPFADGIELAIIPEYANRLSQFQAGNVHFAGINANDVLQLRKDQPKVQWRGLLSALLNFFYFEKAETAPNAAWRDDRFRKAVSMTQDRDSLTEAGYNVKKLQEAGLDVSILWNNIVPAGYAAWWLDPRGKDMGAAAEFFKFNKAEAKKLLDASGYKGNKIPFIYTNKIYGSTFDSLAEATANYLREGGVNVEIQTQDYASLYITQTFRSNFKGIAFGLETPFPEVGNYFARLFGDDSQNHGKIKDAKITELDRKQAVELNAEKRREFIWEIQRINADKMYYVPSQIGAGVGWTAYRPEVRGIIQTRAYGAPTETLPERWLDV